MHILVLYRYWRQRGLGSSVGIATAGWTMRWSDPDGGEIFRTCPDRPWGPPSLLYNGYRVFPGGKERPGRDAEPPPPSSVVGHERVELYLYSPYGPYDLYRASVPVQEWPLPLPLPIGPPRIELCKQIHRKINKLNKKYYMPITLDSSAHPVALDPLLSGPWSLSTTQYLCTCNTYNTHVMLQNPLKHLTRSLVPDWSAVNNICTSLPDTFSDANNHW